MKVVVSKEDLKLYNGTEAIYPHMGDVVDLPDEIAEAEIASGFVQRVDGLDDEEEGEPEEPRRKKKKRKAMNVEEEDEEE